MGNCTGGCNNCSESKKERRAMREYQRMHNSTSKSNTMPKPKPSPEPSPKPKSIEIPSQSTFIANSGTNSTNSTISNLSPYPQQPYTSYPQISPIKSQIHEKTMELLSYDEDDDESVEIGYNNTENIALSSTEIKDSNARIRRLSNTVNSVELEAVIHEQYSQDDEGMEEDDGSDTGSESELSAEEILEIQRRKSDQIQIQQQYKNKHKHKGSFSKHPNLIRDNTSTPWNDSDIDLLTNDMKKELLSLKDINSTKDKNHTKKKSKSKSNSKMYTIVISGSVSSADVDEDDNDKEDTAPYANLFREQSRDKWDTTDMTQTKEDMERAMFDLMKAEIKNRDKDGMRDKTSSCDSTGSSMSVPPLPLTDSGSTIVTTFSNVGNVNQVNSVNVAM